MSRRRALCVGAVAGCIAAVVSAIPGIVHVALTGEPWWKPVQLIATIVGLDDSASFQPPLIIIGGALHVLLSLAYGALFGLATRGLRRAWLAPAGIAYGAAIYLVSFELAGWLGWFDVLLARTDHGVELLAHVVFGFVVALVLRIDSPNGARTG